MARILEDYKAQFRRPNNTLIQLILINVTVFVIASLVRLGGDQARAYTSFFLTMYSDLGILLYHPWTIITSFFTHFGFFHIVSNMLGLYWFGMIVEDLIGSKKLLSLYVLGGLVGNIAFLLLYNLPGMPALQILGASGAVFAIVVAAAVLSPDYRLNLIFFGPVKISYIAAVYVFMSVLGLGGGNAGGNMAHLGGAALGWLYVVQLRKGNDLGYLVHFVLDFFKSITSKKSRMKVSHSKKEKKKAYANTKASTGTSRSTGSNIADQQEIDRILDKISATGYESLSKEEKDKLFSAGKN